MCTNRSTLVAIRPGTQHIDEWEMGDVERIGNVTKESVNGFRLTALYTASRTNGNDNGETNDDTEGFVKTVRPTAISFST